VSSQTLRTLTCDQRPSVGGTPRSTPRRRFVPPEIQPWHKPMSIACRRSVRQCRILRRS
jgi:hypothetical protein